jgi:hypothetical protein
VNISGLLIIAPLTAILAMRGKLPGTGVKKAADAGVADNPSRTTNPIEPR